MRNNPISRSPSNQAACPKSGLRKLPEIRPQPRLCYFWCIPGGLLADSIGRYKTIVGFGCIYALGTLLVACAVFDGVQRELGRHGPSETFAMLIFSSREQWEKPW